MTTHYADERVTLHHGDCLDVLRSLPDASVDAVVTDPPYGLEFMGKDWDAPWKAEGAHWREASRLPGSHSTNPTPRPQNFGTAGKPFQDWCELWTAECLRVLKPGGHLLAFGGTRTWHRLACAVEDAGFEVRDSIAWLYGSGFPKSLDVSKAIDKAAGAEREVVGSRTLTGTAASSSAHVGNLGGGSGVGAVKEVAVTAPATPDAERWQGWGTALKPAFEPVVVARKPLGGTVAQTVLEHGTGALNIDATRVYTDWSDRPESWKRSGNSAKPDADKIAAPPGVGITTHPAGRWPTNVLLDDSQAAELDRQSGVSASKRAERGAGKGATATYGEWGTLEDTTRGHDDTGGASRFFPTFRYEAKAPSSERPRIDGIAHPTVKPLDLMRWLVRLVTPPGGTVLEPFAGSGTTVEAAICEGFHCIAIEREADYLPLVMQRVNRRLNPIEAIKAAGDDLGLFDLGDIS